MRSIGLQAQYLQDCQNTITDPFLLQSGLNSPTKPRPLPGNSLEQLLSRLGADQSEIELATASLRQTQNVSDNINNDRIGTRSDAFWMETIQHGQVCDIRSTTYTL